MFSRSRTPGTAKLKIARSSCVALLIPRVKLISSDSGASSRVSGVFKVPGLGMFKL